MLAHYRALKIKPGATAEEIRKAYKKRSLETHPDKGGSKEEFHEVSEAWCKLKTLTAPGSGATFSMPTPPRPKTAGNMSFSCFGQNFCLKVIKS